MKDAKNYDMTYIKPMIVFVQVTISSFVYREDIFVTHMIIKSEASNFLIVVIFFCGCGSENPRILSVISYIYPTNAGFCLRFSRIVDGVCK